MAAPYYGQDYGPMTTSYDNSMVPYEPSPYDNPGGFPITTLSNMGENMLMQSPTLTNQVAAAGLDMLTDYISTDVSGSRGQDRREDRRDRREARKDGASRAELRADRRDDKAERRQEYGYRGVLDNYRENRDVAQGRGFYGNDGTNFRGNGATNTKGQGGGCAPPPMDCFQQCEARMVALQEKCRQMNEEHVERMKAMGCTGVTCTLPVMGKTCSSKTGSLTQSGRAIKAAKSGCGCK